MIKRAEAEGDPWSGHVACPGGRMEPGDHDLEQTAIRETWEETGVDLARDGQVLGALDDISPRTPTLPPIIVRPFVAVVKPDLEIVQSSEVAEAFWVPLAALRQRAAAVTQIELLPAPPPSRAAANPWPTWPYVFRTSSSQEEGGDRAFAFRTTHLEGDAGRLVALHGERVDSVDSPGPRVRIPVDTLILALGFTGPDAAPLAAELGIALDARGNITVDPRHATSAPGIYCAGDAHRGASLIVWAIAEGRELARHVDADLRGDRSALPARGQDLPF